MPRTSHLQLGHHMLSQPAHPYRAHALPDCGYPPCETSPPSCPPPTSVQVLAGSFLALDVALDAREYIFPEGERSPDFQGFHKLERLIFGWVQGGPAHA